MERVKMLVFDMDGTIADLYGQPNWLEMLRSENPTPYIKAEPMWDMMVLAETLTEFRNRGGIVAVVTWLAKGSSEPYKALTRTAKLEWLERMGFPYDRFHGVQYGATKANSVRECLREGETAILFDDSEQVRKGWHLGTAIDPTAENIIEYIKGLLGQQPPQKEREG